MPAPTQRRGGGAPKRTTWSLVKSDLDALGVEDGSVALWSPDATKPAGCFTRIGSGQYRLQGRLRLWLLDATSGLDIGTLATNAIQRLGSAIAPTWGTAGSEATGGLILDGSGGYALRFLEPYDGVSLIACGARIVPTASSPSDGQEWACGLYSPTTGDVLAGGAERISGDWYRQCLYDAATAPLSLNLASAVYKITGGPAAGPCGISWVPAHAATDTGAFVAGSYQADSSPAANNNRTSVGSILTQCSQTDFVPWIWADASGGTLTARVTEISVMEVTL